MLATVDEALGKKAPAEGVPPWLTECFASLSNTLENDSAWGNSRGARWYYPYGRTWGCCGPIPGLLEASPLRSATGITIEPAGGGDGAWTAEMDASARRATRLHRYLTVFLRQRCRA